MRVSEVIRQADELRPNTITDERKAAWVESLDLRIEDMMLNIRGVEEAVRNYSRGIFDKRILSCLVQEGIITTTDYRNITNAQDDEDIVSAERTKYPAEDVKLLLPDPYAETYVLFLIAKIDFYNQETELYMNDKAAYSTALAEAEAWWRRENRARASKGWVV